MRNIEEQIDEYFTLISHAGVAVSIAFLGSSFNILSLKILGFILSYAVFLWTVFKVAKNLALAYRAKKEQQTKLLEDKSNSQSK